MGHHLEVQPFRFFDLPPELRLRVYDYVTWQLIIDDAESGLSIVASDLPLVPVFLANKQLAGEYRQQWNCSFQGGISLIVFERGFSTREWPYVVPECLRSRVMTCCAVYPLNCWHYRNLAPAKCLEMVDYGMLREICEKRHKRSEQVEHLPTDANEEFGADRYQDDGQSFQDEGLVQLAGLDHVNDHRDDAPCLSIDAFDLHMDTTDIIAEFRTLKSLHFAFPMW